MKLAKKAIIIVSLVEESKEKENEELEMEISQEVAKWPANIPWMKELEKVSVIDNR